MHVELTTPERLHRLTEEAKSGLHAMNELIVLNRSKTAMVGSLTASETQDLRDLMRLVTDLQNRIVPLTGPSPFVRSLTAIADNMEQSIAALGPALAEIETPVSPQLARSVAATENAWRELEAEFGLLSSLEVSELVGSRSPNRSYASEQHAKARLIAVKRPGGLRYPGFQIDRSEHIIRPVMADLIRIAGDAGRSEASLALWMTSRTGYLDGHRPVDQLSRPDKVAEAARQSFNVQW